MNPMDVLIWVVVVALSVMTATLCVALIALIYSLIRDLFERDPE